MSDIDDAFADGPTFIPYIAVGDPDAAASVEYVEALCRGGADVIELGLPFSEPIAEGLTIQNAVIRSLEGGMTPEHFFETVSSIDVDVPLVCMTYYNLIYQFGRRTAGEPGPGPFAERAAEVGIDGFVVPDLPAEEADPLRDACDAHAIDLIFIVAPTTRSTRLKRIMAQVSGYVYVQARLGVTGARADVSIQTTESLDRLSNWDVPKAVGFGIESGAHAREVVAAGADGVIVGSALVDLIAEGQDAGDSVATVAERLETKARELKGGALDGAESDVDVDAGVGTEGEPELEARPERK